MAAIAGLAAAGAHGGTRSADDAGQLTTAKDLIMCAVLLRWAGRRDNNIPWMNWFQLDRAS
jgi:hypothetical protein